MKKTFLFVFLICLCFLGLFIELVLHVKGFVYAIRGYKIGIPINAKDLIISNGFYIIKNLFYLSSLVLFSLYFFKSNFSNHIRYTYEEYKAKMDAKKTEKKKAKIEKLKAEIEKQEKGE